MTVIVCPTPDHRIERPYQVLLLRSAILMNHITYLSRKACMFFLEGVISRRLPLYLRKFLPQEVEPLVDMRDAGFLG